MIPGRLRTRGTIQRVTTTQDASGGVVETWANKASRRLNVRPLRGQELYSAQQKIGEVTHAVGLRWDCAIADLSAADRIMIGARVFHILVVRNLDERSVEYELLCREVA